MLNTEKKLNVLIITSRADFGGGPKHILSLLNHLNKRINFSIACPNEYPYYKVFSSIIGVKNMFVIPHRKFKSLKLFKLIYFLRANKIDIIHSHGKGAGIYSRLLTIFSGIQTIHTFHGLHIGEYNFIKRNIYLWMEKFLSLFTKAFITVSDSERNKILLNNITQKDKMNKIENGVEIIQDKTVSYYADKSELNLITISRFDFAKNSLLLIPIIKELEKLKSDFNFTISILGDGIEIDNFRKKLTYEGLTEKIKLLGSQLNIVDFLINSFCYISTSKWEGMPLGIIEAMAVGLPVVATNVTGNKDVVKNNVNGFLYDIDKPKEAAEYIIKIANDKDLWGRFSEASKDLAQRNYSAERMANETFDLYNRILNNGN